MSHSGSLIKQKIMDFLILKSVMIIVQKKSPDKKIQKFDKILHPKLFLLPLCLELKKNKDKI